MTDKDDEMKLVEGMQYNHQIRRIPLTIEAANLNVIAWWIDGTFASHHDIRSHTGAAISLGTGTVTGISRRKMFNTQCRDENCEVGVSWKYTTVQ